MKKICIFVMILMVCLICGCSKNSKNMMANTTWIMNDGSEVVFTDDSIMWYKDPSDHTKNYYSGKYKFFIGRKAINYVVNDLSEYGVTNDKLQNLFDRNLKYSENNFIIIDINFDVQDLNGIKNKIEKPSLPWIGFILNNNTYLDVANMRTSVYYSLTKQN